MITYAENLYLSNKYKNDTKKLDDIKWKLEHKAGTLSTYITLASNENDVFDIIRPYMFKLKRFYDLDIHIMGIAESETEAYEMIKEMTEEYLSSNINEMSMREYFIRKCN